MNMAGRWERSPIADVNPTEPVSVETEIVRSGKTRATLPSPGRRAWSGPRFASRGAHRRRGQSLTCNGAAQHLPCSCWLSAPDCEGRGNSDNLRSQPTPTSPQRICWRGQSARTGLLITAITPDAASAVCRKSTPQTSHNSAQRGFFIPGNTQRLEATPLVVRGIMYVTSANDVFALDARTGRVVWHYQRPVSAGLLDDAAAHKNRGVAVWQHFVYAETDDAHLLCLDARSGSLLWDVRVRGQD